jgi:hypothetical protein
MTAAGLTDSVTVPSPRVKSLATRPEHEEFLVAAKPVRCLTVGHTKVTHAQPADSAQAPQRILPGRAL